MATVKSYTDIPQSKKLAEFLPLESADMYYEGHQSIINPKEWEYGDTPKIRGKYISFDDKRIFYPCWSLASLLNVLSLPDLIQDKIDDELFWLCSVYDEDGKLLCEAYCSNPVDACYEMVLKLHELNLL